MRTTIELPDDFFLKVKVKAAQDGLRLKDLITHYIAVGLEGRYGIPDPEGPHNDDFPLIRTR